MRTEAVTSAQNAKVKNLLLLQEKSKARREQGLFVVEGRREVEHCLSAGFVPRTLFLCDTILPDSDREALSAQAERLNPQCTFVSLPETLYRKVAYREGTEGVIAEVRYRERTLEDLVLSDHPLIVVLEAVEKPGNLGAVLRSADAARADAVILCDPLTDLYNPNLIRASLGALFTVPTVAAASGEVITWLRARGIRILTAQLQDSEWYYDTDMQGGTALVLGTESTGLTDRWRQAADAHIRIPMLGRLDSLNVSVSAAILLFEAVRQRHTAPGAPSSTALLPSSTTR
ncbi:MAG: RNA methyltransferase [Bacteroidales bacterium]|nr:RNA methyltransferase [Bacteroidales bacterium]